MTIENLTVQQIEARQAARAEVEAYRETNRRTREFEARQAETAEQEIATAIRQRREQEARQAEIQAERARIYAERELRIEAERASTRPSTTIAESAARSLAKRLRVALGGEFDSIVAEMRKVDSAHLHRELARVPQDEHDAIAARQRAEEAARQAAASLEIPAPLDATEALILARHGLSPVEKRRAELADGAL